MISPAFVCYTDNAVLFIVAIFDNSAVLALEFVENIDDTTFALGT